MYKSMQNSMAPLINSVTAATTVNEETLLNSNSLTNSSNTPIYGTMAPPSNDPEAESIDEETFRIRGDVYDMTLGREEEDYYTSTKSQLYFVCIPIIILIVGGFIIIAIYAWPLGSFNEDEIKRYPHRLHLAEFAIGAAAWLASEALRRPIFDLLPLSVFHHLAITLPYVLSTIVQELLRLGAIAISVSWVTPLEQPEGVHIQHTPAFAFYRESGPLSILGNALTLIVNRSLLARYRLGFGRNFNEIFNSYPPIRIL